MSPEIQKYYETMYYVDMVCAALFIISIVGMGIWLFVEWVRAELAFKRLKLPKSKERDWFNY